MSSEDKGLRISGALMSPAHLSPSNARMQILLLLGGFLPAGIALAFLSELPTASLLVLIALLAACCFAMLALLQGKAYGPSTDLLREGKWQRGAFDVDAQDDPTEVVRTLYMCASYDTAKTGWPIALLYSFLGALALGSVLTCSSSWILSVFVSFVTMVLVQAYIAGYYFAHGGVQAQMYRDMLYCKYRSLIAAKSADGSASSTRVIAGRGSS